MGRRAGSDVSRSYLGLSRRKIMSRSAVDILASVRRVCVCVFFFFVFFLCFFFQAEDGIRDLVRSRGLGDVYKRQPQG